MVSAIVRKRCSLTASVSSAFFRSAISLASSSGRRKARIRGMTGISVITAAQQRTAAKQPQQAVKAINGPLEDERVHEVQRAAREQKALEDPERARRRARSCGAE